MESRTKPPQPECASYQVVLCLFVLKSSFGLTVERIQILKKPDDEKTLNANHNPGFYPLAVCRLSPARVVIDPGNGRVGIAE